MTSRINIADVLVIDDRVMWQPKPKFIALGFTVTDCGIAGSGEAKEQINEMMRQARLAKRAENARILARADRIRAAYA